MPEWSLVLQREQILLPVPVASCQYQTLAIKQAQSPGAQRDICIVRERVPKLYTRLLPWGGKTEDLQAARQKGQEVIFQ